MMGSDNDKHTVTISDNCQRQEERGHSSSSSKSESQSTPSYQTSQTPTYCVNPKLAKLDTLVETIISINFLLEISTSTSSTFKLENYLNAAKER
jgi:hypothetical protein